MKKNILACSLFLIIISLHSCKDQNNKESQNPNTTKNEGQYSDVSKSDGKEYKIIMGQANSNSRLDDIRDLEVKVNRAIQDGYKVIGGVCSDAHMGAYYQAVIKE